MTPRRALERQLRVVERRCMTSKPTVFRCERHSFVTIAETLHANGYVSRVVKCKVCDKQKRLQAVAA